MALTSVLTAGVLLLTVCVAKENNCQPEIDVCNDRLANGTTAAASSKNTTASCLVLIEALDCFQDKEKIKNCDKTSGDLLEYVVNDTVKQIEHQGANCTSLQQRHRTTAASAAPSNEVARANFNPCLIALALLFSASFFSLQCSTSKVFGPSSSVCYMSS